MAEFSIEDLIPTSLIRSHTKYEDVEHVTDALLIIYRKSAIEAAEQYTGLLLRSAMQIVEVANPQVENPHRICPKQYVNVKTNYPVTDGVIYYTIAGGKNGIAKLEPQTRKVRLPVLSQSMTDSCCTYNGGLQFFVSLQYLTGYNFIDEVPSGIILGCLKHIAWSVENPGDVIQTVANLKNKNPSGAIGANNASLASGALDLWRQYNLEA
jgi:hypothetical protein